LCLNRRERPELFADAVDEEFDTTTTLAHVNIEVLTVGE
jgi:hypothetical protein